MVYKKIVNHMISLDQADFDVLTKIKKMVRELQDPPQLDIINSLKSFEEIVLAINQLSTTSDGINVSVQDRFINRTERLALAEQQQLVRVQGKYKETFKKYDIVKLNFGGVGSEIDSPHFAIVIHADATFEEISVIPLSSKNYLTNHVAFRTKPIPGLPTANSTVLVHKLCSMSRKRLIKSASGRYVYTTFPHKYRHEVEWRIALYQQGNVSLYTTVYEKCGVFMPKYMTAFLNDRFLPVLDVHFDPATAMLQYRPWNSTMVKQIELVNFNAKPTDRTDMYDYKKALLRRLCSEEEPKISLAQADLSIYWTAAIIR